MQQSLSIYFSVFIVFFIAKRRNLKNVIIGRLSKFVYTKAELNVGNVPVLLNSQKVMGHELGHVYDILNGKPADHFESSVIRIMGLTSISISSSETNAMYWENILRAQSGLPLRKYYFYTNNPTISWANGNAIITYDPKSGQPISISNLDGNTYILK